MELSLYWVEAVTALIRQVKKSILKKLKRQLNVILISMTVW
jgi:hypothetical protein